MPLNKGIYPGHSYTITDHFKLTDEYGKEEQVIRFRNPHGKGKEWNGKWCDGDTQNWDLTNKDDTLINKKTVHENESFRNLLIKGKGPKKQRFTIHITN